MGNKRIESVFDLIRWNLDLTVECRGCGRLSVFDAAEVRDFLVARRRDPNCPPSMSWPPSIPFVCRCSGRDARIAFADKRLRPTPLPPRKLGLVAIYVVEREG